MDPATKNFKGANPEIDAVIGLKHEVKDFEKFTEKCILCMNSFKAWDIFSSNKQREYRSDDSF